MFYFNKTPIGTGKTVTAATLTVYSVSELHNLGYAYYGVTGVTPLVPGTVSLGDYSNFSNTAYSDTWINGSAYGVSSAFQNYTFNSAGLSAINSNEWTSLMIRDWWDITGTFNGTWVSGAVTQVRISTSEAPGKVPFLTLTYETSGGDTTPPASLSGFANITSCSGTNISFEKPTDADYDGFMAWWDNVAESNQTNATTWYNKSGLTESTTYTLSTKTFDLSGNVNATFQNYSITTGACGVAPVAAFSASNTTMCVGNVTRFTDESTNTPTSWYWEFGDGNTSTTQNPLVQYDVIGLKTVNLKATNAYGSDWENKTGYINVTTCAAPTPTPTPTPTTPPTPTPTPPEYPINYCGTQHLYFQNNTNMTPEGYNELINYPSGDPEVDTSITIKNTDGPVLLGTYIMSEGSLSGISALLKGLRRYHYYTYVDSAVGTTTLNFTAFRRVSNGTEQDFYSIQTPDIDDLAVTEHDMNYASPNTLTLDPTERLGIKVYGTTTHSSPIVLHFVYQGELYASYFETGYFVCPVVSGGGGGNINPVGNYMALTFIAIGIASLGLFVAVYALRRRQLYK